MLIWDEQSGYDNFLGLATIMFLIQLAYWAVNFFIMFLVTGKAVKAEAGNQRGTGCCEE
jgi:hypothetical protein